ncbi:DNA-3-methyladenine glycosylase, putative [Plasmodium gallinaceum]|uniref:DNA-3-methyladenine glycosylase II n=1 Tax=Plasmodium gallinaceum TaxID=5849 RepID=A0A1J1GRG9_PLAGA|nr:DNA-3-methyladenine glycosylase, putative [Plasmodium gallinaceum]CRG94868.1 DNA-3-methyladenine glycosylase, putative [Plasmodium gallinaceum]
MNMKVEKKQNKSLINKQDIEISNQKDLKQKLNIKKKKIIKEIKILEKKKPIDTFNLAYVYILLKYFFDNNNIDILNEHFYLQDNVLNITEDLIGHILWVFDKNENKLYGSRIIELESYNGAKDKASHAYNNKKTNRNLSMFEKGGRSYVYICYGIHNCLNIVTNLENIPEAILIRSLEPIYNIEYFISNKFKNTSENLYFENFFENDRGYKVEDKEYMKKRKNDIKDLINKENYLKKIDKVDNVLKMINKKKLVKLCSGPGCVTKCLKVTRQDDMEYFYIDLLNNNIKKEDKLKKEVNYNKNMMISINYNDNNKSSKYFNNSKLLNDKGKSKKKNIDGINVSNKNNSSSNILLHDSSKNIKSNYYFSSNINNLEKSRFFISICPTVNDILYFYETLRADKNEEEYIIKNIYDDNKMYLLEYFDYMKWQKDKLIIQKDKRIGINYAEEAALYEYRFLLKNHPSVTFPPK